MKIAKISATEVAKNRIKKLKSEMTLSALMGDYKGFKKAKIEYSKEGVKNFELLKTIKGGGVSNVPLFSKFGFNMLKVMFLNFFRIKTPEEKEFARMCKEEAIKNNKKINFNI